VTKIICSLDLLNYIAAIRNVLALSQQKTTVRCEQIQTFAVLDEWQVASREQLEKTVIEKYKPFFYSKKWNQEGYPSGNMSFEYPLLAIIPQSQNIKGIAGGECSNSITFHLAVLDYIAENYDNYKYSYVDKNGVCACNCSSKKICDSRNQFEIENDTSILLQNFLRQLSTVGAFNNIGCEECEYFAYCLKIISINNQDMYFEINPFSNILKNVVWPKCI
jgi:hypothetical protein